MEEGGNGLSLSLEMISSGFEAGWWHFREAEEGLGHMDIQGVTPLSCGQVVLLSQLACAGIFFPGPFVARSCLLATLGCLGKTLALVLSRDLRLSLGG